MVKSTQIPCNTCPSSQLPSKSHLLRQELLPLAAELTQAGWSNAGCCASVLVSYFFVDIVRSGSSCGESKPAPEHCTLVIAIALQHVCFGSWTGWAWSRDDILQNKSAVEFWAMKIEKTTVRVTVVQWENGTFSVNHWGLSPWTLGRLSPLECDHKSKVTKSKTSIREKSRTTIQDFSHLCTQAGGSPKLHIWRNPPKGLQEPKSNEWSECEWDKAKIIC